ncbi:uncharacterized protein LOC123871214 isoform X2 [Maniola jurtina]|uniref:uncharacterized protein LOC123871214 isoform X2 n=1 Tax=Maniola jurtina TaxID=191418 RepID=UPI001E68D633|nr:uncharacterized protein LOC123871214 isoform X2 [Maniola jurtina]
MKTSQSQFDLMVTFMEQHGDLSKPSANARGRISRLSKWEELAHLLNSDDSGDTKTSEKWKKVWSDFKNNTKKKAARLHRAASGTAATYCKLTDLEQRVLNLTGVQVATSLAVGEAGLSQEIPNEPDSMNVEQVPLTSEVVIKTIAEPVPPSQTRAMSSPPLGFIEEKVQRSQPWNELGPSASYTAAVPPQARPATPLFTFVESQVEDPGMRSPTRPSTHVHDVRPGPALSGQTTPPRGIQRKKVRPAHTKQAAQQFLQAEKFWRKFKIKQHRDYMDMRREQNRIREMEVQAQREWQKVGLRALEILDKLANKFCKD